MKREKEMSDSLHARAKPAKTDPDKATAAATGSFPCCALNASRIYQLCAPAHHTRCPLAGVLISFALSAPNSWRSDRAGFAVRLLVLACLGLFRLISSHRILFILPALHYSCGQPNMLILRGCLLAPVPASFCFGVGQVRCCCSFVDLDAFGQRSCQSARDTKSCTLYLHEELIWIRCLVSS